MGNRKESRKACGRVTLKSYLTALNPHFGQFFLDFPAGSSSVDNRTSFGPDQVLTGS